MALRKGVNVDLVNPHGNVAVEELRGMSLVRLPINTRQVEGRIDFHAAVSLYRPYILALHQNGIDPVLVITHQTWGEGQGFNFADRSIHMRSHDWDRLFIGVVNMTRRFLNEIPVKPIIQVWNEQDSQDDRASVIIPPDQYGRLVQMMRQSFPDYRLMTGGYCSGAGRSIQQLKASNILNLVDYVAFHPYGQGAGGVNNIFGLLKDEVGMWRSSVPASKLVATEFGLMTETDRPTAQVANYMMGALEEFKRAKIAGAIWYAYDDRMDNCIGIRRNGQVVQILRGMLNESGGVDQTTRPSLCPPSTR
jgi:hypothetical protein